MGIGIPLIRNSANPIKYENKKKEKEDTLLKVD